MRRVLILTACVCGWMILGQGAMALGYDYPLTNRFTATVLGTPAEFAADLPAKVPVKVASLKMFPDREVPDILWNLSDLRYSYIRQKQKAPLVFLIAGTGASFRSPKMVTLQKAFFQAGYHVVSLSSPTHPNFIVAASTSGVPGHLTEDSADLYRVMQAIWAKLQTKLEVSAFYLSGYSLGAAQSAFVAHLDEQQQAFNFQKVLLINPPVNLFHSVEILDRMLEENIPGGMDNFNAFYKKITDAFADAYAHGDDVEFNDQFLYATYKYRKPKSDEPLQALIGMDFRLSSSNMAFTTDVLTQAGYVVPKGMKLGRHAHVTEFAKILNRLSFQDYFDDIFLPHFQAKDPELTESQLIEQTGLKRIENYLMTSPKLGLIGNEDDFILRPGEVSYLREVFGDRATIFPHGGHCGNMAFPDNIAAMLGFFQNSHIE